MSDYKSLLSPFLADVEGNSSTAYNDSKGVPTAGYGFNLDDKENHGIMQMHGIDPNEVKMGTRKIASEEADRIKSSILDRKEALVRDRMGSDLFETLNPNKKAALVSLGYQSLNNIGPNLQEMIAKEDDPLALKELILNTNADSDPGILSRRMKEAQLYNPDPVTFSSAFKLMDNEEKSKLVKIINKTKNENTKKELMDKYGQYLGMTSEPLKFNKLSKLMGK